jgi:cyclomaltodextrinase / maltogenic alpha-amylase / neopullulanase
MRNVAQPDATTESPMPDWIKHAIWWHLYPLGFVGAERLAQPQPAISHRLGHLTQWLDYAIKLGTSGLMLGPIFQSSSHGYDTIDHFRIDPRLGDDADFDALLTAARHRGLHVVLDGVFNHVGRAFPAFQDVLIQGPQSRHAKWFRLSSPSGEDAGREPDYATFEGHHQLVALNHAEPAVRDYIARVMTHWLNRGVDGWRLDAAYAVPALGRYPPASSRYPSGSVHLRRGHSWRLPHLRPGNRRRRRYPVRTLESYLERFERSELF